MPQPRELCESDSVLLTIESLSNQADGVARHRGKVVFVPFALPGERVRVRITESKKDYARGTVERIARRSPDRVDAPCPYYGVCGGCQLQHAGYEHALELKGRAFAETVERIGKLQVRIPPLVPSPPYAYRNKSRFFATGRADIPMGLKLGHNAERTMPIERCLLVSTRIGYAYEEVGRRIGAESARGVRLPFSAVTFQEMEGGLAVTVEGVPEDREYVGNWTRVLQDIIEVRAGFLTRSRSRRRVSWHPLFGEEIWIRPVGRFQVPASPGTFHQVNDHVAEKLYETILGWIGKHWDFAVELYCGTGALAAELARKFRKVLAADENPRAVSLAEKTFGRLKPRAIRFLASPAEKVLFHKDLAGRRPDLMVLDPPRAGCSPRVMQGIALLRPRRVVLVSCHPAVFARDLGKLVSAGYRIADLRAFDMFPQTYHLEVAAVLAFGPAPADSSVP